MKTHRKPTLNIILTSKVKISTMQPILAPQNTAKAQTHRQCNAHYRIVTIIYHTYIYIYIAFSYRLMCIHVCIKRCLKSRVSRSHQRAGGINVACYPYLNSPQAASNHIKQQQHSRLFWHVLPTKLDNRIFIQKKFFF